MKLAIKHKSGRVLFVTSDEFIADNRRKMGWIVEEVRMTSREQFEKYAADRLGLTIEMIFDARNGDRYLHAFDSMSVMQPLNGWWAIWQASRAAIEIELPTTIEVHPLGPSVAKMFCDLHKNTVAECAKSIRDSGLKIKGE